MKELTQRHYDATRERGCITVDTGYEEFLEKIQEELDEAQSAYDKGDFIGSVSEVVDVFAVCLNMFEHFGFDAKRLYRANVEHQESRI